MQPNWAEENLQVIRTLMERSALYRRALAPVMFAVGAIGIVAGIIGPHLGGNMLHGFLYYWMTVCAVVIAVALGISRRQAIKDKDPFWSAPTRRMVLAMLPAVFSAAGPTVVFGCLGLDRLASDTATVFVLFWWVFYGCALHSAALFISRGMRRLAWGFISTPFVFMAIGSLELNPIKDLSPHWLMGATFGGFHLLAGIYLYFTEKGRNAQ